MTCRRILLVAVVLGALATALPYSAEGPGAATVLRRADLVRNPYLGTALDIDMSVESKESGRELRNAHYVMLTHRGGRTLLLMPQKDPTAPGALLITENAYHLLLPLAERPIELAFRHVVAGDLSHAGFLRMHLWASFEPRLDGEETLGDERCWRLELVPKSGTAPIGRVRYWVAQRGFLPIRIEFYDERNELLKTARFTLYQDTGTGPRPARIEIEDALRPGERTTLRLGRPQAVRTSDLGFGADDLVALRDTARRLATETEGPANGEQLVEALLARAEGTGR